MAEDLDLFLDDPALALIKLPPLRKPRKPRHGERSTNDGRFKRVLSKSKIKKWFLDKRPDVTLLETQYDQTIRSWRVFLECNECRNRIGTTFSAIRGSGSGCKNCKGKAQWLLEEVSSWLLHNRSASIVQILDDKWRGAHTRLRLKCSICQYDQWIGIFHNILNGTKCLNCSNMIRWSQKDAEEWLMQNRSALILGILDGEWRGVLTRLLLKCSICQYDQWMTRFNNIKNGGSECPRCFLLLCCQGTSKTEQRIIEAMRCLLEAPISVTKKDAVAINQMVVDETNLEFGTGFNTLIAPDFYAKKGEIEDIHFPIFLDYDGGYWHANKVKQDTAKSWILLRGFPDALVIRIRHSSLPDIKIDSERHLIIINDCDTVDKVLLACTEATEWIRSHSKVYCEAS